MRGGNLSGAANSFAVVNSIKVTVSGSFRRAMGEVQAVVEDLVDAGAFVLSPSDPRIVDAFGDFVFVASDSVRQIRSVQGRHLAAIKASDFLWLVAPEGYVGQSAAMEIGYAAACQIPIYSDEVPSDLTLRQWVKTSSSPRTVIKELLATERNRPYADRPYEADSLLLEPKYAIEASHNDLLIAQNGLLGSPTAEETDAAELALRRINSRTAIV